MSNQAVARRYARALFDLAREKNQIDQVEQDLAAVVESVRTLPEVRALFDNQLLAPKMKQTLLLKTFSEKLSPLTLNFLGVLCRRRREGQIAVIFDLYTQMANEARGQIEVEVRSAVALGAEAMTGLENRLTQRLGGKRLKLKTTVDPDLIGGLVVRVDDTLFDGSIKTRLQRLRERLTHSSKANQ